MRCAIDTGGTFTDLALEREGTVRIFKASTTPDNPIAGILDVLGRAARSLGMERAELLGEVSMLIHGTTRATNAVLTGNTAKTALVTTMGHGDVLLLREGGRTRSFDWSQEYPDGYVPRALTFEAAERIDSQGRVLRRLDELALIHEIERMAGLGVEAVAVCLLWSIVNAKHERRVGELLEEHLPGVPFTLSHRLNPTLREYRRASSTAIDASLKPLMTNYLENLEASLSGAGFGGELLLISTSGGLMRSAEAAARPITSINSGPAMAPVAGRLYSGAYGGAEDAIVADTGGTSYDVSVVRGGRIPMTRETWLGEPLVDHITGFPAVDVKSIGAGGGSIAWIDDGGLLHVGPQSAGAEPGPASYGHGGERATITDACLVLGYLDPASFLGGTMQLRSDLAADAIRRDVADPLGLGLEQAAAAVMALATEEMVQAITEITVDAGIDPRGAVLVGGGGAAGLNSGAIMRRLGCKALMIPESGAALSAVGALIADLSADFAQACFTSSESFDFAGFDAVLDDLRGRCRGFAAEVGAERHEIELVAEARLARQVWQIDVPLRRDRFGGEEAAAVAELVEDFQRLHEEIFAVRDERSAVEVVALRARVLCSLESRSDGRFAGVPAGADGERQAYFAGHGTLSTPVRSLGALEAGEQLAGPALVESPLTTVVIEPGAVAERWPGAGLVVRAEDGAGAGAEDRGEVHYVAD
jgi:N-methylhydantoinase A